MTDRKWTEEKIIRLIREWVDTYGDPPTRNEWTHHPDYPSPAVVNQYFGNWTNAVTKAGYTPRRRGQPNHLVPALHHAEQGFGSWRNAD